MSGSHHPVRSPLGKWAAVSQAAPTLSDEEKRELGRRLWQQHGAVVVLEGWAPKVF